MDARLPNARLRRLPRATVLGREVPVAVGLRARLLGLAHLDPEQAGAGLLIPNCSSVHTFGMRFPLDLVFLNGWAASAEQRSQNPAGAGGLETCSGSEGYPQIRLVTIHRDVPPRRLVWCRAAAAVLELPTEDE